jgi:hypothetical protein
MIGITKTELQTLFDAIKIQDKFDRKEFVHLLVLCRLAMRTGTEKQLFAAVEDVNWELGIEQSEPAPPEHDPLENMIGNTLRDYRAAGLPNPVEPRIHEVTPAVPDPAPEPVPASEPDLNPAITEALNSMRGESITLADGIAVSFLGTGPIPLGVALDVEPRIEQSANYPRIMRRLQIAQELLSGYCHQYRETGTFTPEYVGQTFREKCIAILRYVVNLLKN